MEKIGIIGAGHMAGALLLGLIKSDYIAAKQVIISGGASDKAKVLAQKLHCNFTTSNIEVAQNCDILILGVMPKIMPRVLEEIKAHITPEQLLISLAASFSFNDFYAILPAKTQLARTIPNLPVSVLAGMTAICPSPALKAKNIKNVEKLFQAVGAIITVEENKLDVASTVAGCSPAFYAIFIEALADAGVMHGLSRAEAYLLAEQAALGTAQMLLQNKILPAALKDDVTSPGGTTIKGIAALEEHGLRNAVIQAVKAATGKSAIV